MKNFNPYLIVLFFFTASIFARDSFIPLFDGKTLNGWSPVPGGRWEVKNGAILGTSPKSENRHVILLSERQYSDIIVQVKFRVHQGDSGFYFRAQKVTSAVGVNGFQVEVDSSQETGGLYEIGGRKWVNKTDAQAIEKRKYQKGEWTELELKAIGRSMVIRINGLICSELKNDPGRIIGFFGLQLDSKEEMRVEYKGIQIEEL